jgi:hypothetical protein
MDELNAKEEKFQNDINALFTGIEFKIWIDKVELLYLQNIDMGIKIRQTLDQRISAALNQKETTVKTFKNK